MTLSLLYKSLVRPHLEYENLIWGPFNPADQKLIERIQCRAIKACAWAQTPAIPGTTQTPPSTISLSPETEKRHVCRLSDPAWRHRRPIGLVLRTCCVGCHKRAWYETEEVPGHFMSPKKHSCSTGHQRLECASSCHRPQPHSTSSSLDWTNTEVMMPSSSQIRTNVPSPRSLMRSGPYTLQAKWPFKFPVFGKVR